MILKEKDTLKHSFEVFECTCTDGHLINNTE